MAKREELEALTVEQLQQVARSNADEGADVSGYSSMVHEDLVALLTDVRLRVSIEDSLAGMNGDAVPEDSEGDLIHRDPMMIDPSVGKGTEDMRGFVPEEGTTTNDVLVFTEAARQASDDAAPLDEELPQINEGNWVRLGMGRGIPKQFRGHEAVVVNAPFLPYPADQTHRNTTRQTRLFQAPDAIFTVRTRDEYSALLSVTRDDIDEVSYFGRFVSSSKG